MANRSNVMGLHGLKNKTSRNSFDLSHRNLFTAKIGELLPCFVQELNPGDSVKVDTSWFTRTAPLQTAAFTRLRENVQFFFVSYSQLWKYFPTQVLNMTKTAAGGDVSRIAESPFENQKVTTQMPYISYAAIHQYLYNIYKGLSDRSSGAWSEKATPWCYNNGELRYAASAKLLQMLGYGNFAIQNQAPKAGVTDYDTTTDFWSRLPNLSLFRLLAYQKICNDHYTFRQWQPYDASLCNVDYLKPSDSELDVSERFSKTSNLQWSSGDDKNQRLNMFDLRFSNLPLDYLNGVLPTAQYGDESVVSLGDTTSLQDGATLVPTFGQQSLSNIYLGTNLSSANGKTVDGLSFGQFGLASSSLPNGKKPWTNETNNAQIKYSDGTTNVNFGVNGVLVNKYDNAISVNSGSLTGELRISALRNALVMQKYKEIQLANDVDFASQVYAHFGVKPHCDDSVSKFLGGNSSMIDINPIVNQNLDGDGMANVKASPIGNGESKIKFTADTYGVVIGIYRCTPVLDYAHVGIDKQLCKTDASDFVIPEMDSIGMQQNYLFELRAPSTFDNVTSTNDADYGASYGYAPRYSEYKTSYDRVNGDFCYTLDSWVTGLTTDKVHDIIESTSPTSTIRYAQIAPELFNCRPDLVNSIFVNQSNLLTSDDKLYVGCVNMCYATRQLSRYGLPYCN